MSSTKKRFYFLLLSIITLGKRAYCAVGGNGYGRVAIRMEEASGELFVLEVNPHCGLSSKPLFDISDPATTRVGTILHLSGTPLAQLMSEIIAEAFAKHSLKSGQIIPAL